MHPLTDPATTAQRIYERTQGNSDVWIAQRARAIAADLHTAILTDAKEAAEVGEEMLGWLGCDERAAMARAIQAGDAAALLALLKPVHDKAVEQVAEYRAIAQFEELTPEDFLPG